jgi:ATP-dependent DNA helicase RecQ
MPKPRIRAAAKKAKAKKPVGDLEYDQNLFEKLRELRKEIAVEQGVPPFVVFSDASLAEMAAVRPQDDGGMLGITGVGKYKLEHYGARFLKILQGPAKNQ